MSRLMELFPRIPRLWDTLDLWAKGPFEPPATYTEPGYPAVNIVEKQDKLYVEAELPSVEATDLDISVTGQDLILSGERKAPSQPEVTWTRQERPYGAFSRSISLPCEIDANSVEATLHDGVLTIALTKSEKSRTKKVAVRTG